MRLIFLVAASMASAGSVANAAEIFVDVADHLYLPRTVIVQVGDTVTWRYHRGSASHNVVADDGSFASQLLPAPWTFSHTFPLAGTFPYHCAAHGAPGGTGMSGTVYVSNRTPRDSNERVLQLDAWDFQPRSTTTTAATADFSRYVTSFQFGSLMAGVSLPAGSEITGIELTGCDELATGNISAGLVRCSGLVDWCPGLADVATTTEGTPGCGFFSAPLEFPDIVDNLGNTYLAVVGAGPSPAGELRIRSLRIYYRTRVSPPAGPGRFTDVPPSHPFFRFVEALAAAGLTAGCSSSPPQFCPNAPVTRGQLAVFLVSALGLHWPN